MNPRNSPLNLDQLSDNFFITAGKCTRGSVRVMCRWLLAWPCIISCPLSFLATSSMPILMLSVVYCSFSTVIVRVRPSIFVYLHPCLQFLNLLGAWHVGHLVPVTSDEFLSHPVMIATMNSNRISFLFLHSKNIFFKIN